MCTSVHISPHIPNNSFFLISDVLYSSLFYYSTVNANQNYILLYYGVIRHILIIFFILALTNLKMTTWVAETCWRQLCYKVTSIKPKCICWSFNTFYAETFKLEPSCSVKIGSLLYEVPSSHDEFCVFHMVSVWANPDCASNGRSATAYAMWSSHKFGRPSLAVANLVGTSCAM